MFYKFLTENTFTEKLPVKSRLHDAISRKLERILFPLTVRSTSG